MDLVKELHDKLLEAMPEGANHPQDCPICSAGDGTTCNHQSEVSMFTQEDMDAAVANAVTPLKDTIADLQKKMEAEAAADAHASEKAELEAKINEFQVQLDKAVLDATSAKTEYDNLVAFLNETIAAAEAEEAQKAKKAGRVQKMKTYAFSDEQVEERADRWAAMSDEEFDTYVSDLEALGAKAVAEAEDAQTTLPTATAMTAAAEVKNHGDKSSAMRSVLSMSRRGIDPATIR